MLYDSFRQRAEIILEQNGIQFRRVYYFDENELIEVTGNILHAFLLTDTTISIVLNP